MQGIRPVREAFRVFGVTDVKACKHEVEWSGMSASGECNWNECSKWIGQVERASKTHLADAETIELLVDANGRSNQV